MSARSNDPLTVAVRRSKAAGVDAQLVFDAMRHSIERAAARDRWRASEAAATIADVKEIVEKVYRRRVRLLGQGGDE